MTGEAWGSLLIASCIISLGAAPSQPGDRDDEPAADPESSPYRALAFRASPGTPEIDGQLDDAVWLGAQPLTGFVQRDPNEGEPATERTEVRVLYDDHALYVGIRAYDSEPDKIVGQLTRRDQDSPSDWLAVSIDSYNDQRTAFEFRVNPAGVERDMYRFDDTNDDSSWDAVWDVATRLDDEGWAAEFRIPFSQLRFSDAWRQVWGFNVERVIQRKNEVAQWKPIPKEGSGWVSEYGELAGIEGIRPPRRLEVLPYVVTQQAFSPAQSGNPFETGSAFMGNAGGDLRYGLTNSLTVNLTLNPDFGQVEADPSVVNLSAFETFFQEKRPFFLEGSNIFSYGLSGGGGIEQLFYSRRIGRSPQGSADTRGGYADEPSHTTILGAAKLSGKTGDGWSIGVLDALTAEERATVIGADNTVHHDVVEPLTNYGVARIQKDFREGRTAVGGIVTAVNRNLPDNLGDLRSSAYTGGIDVRTKFGGGEWEATGQVVGSYVRGSEEAISETQQSSARYFQRPDAAHLDLDPARTSLFGSSGALSLRKIGGGHWRAGLRTQWVSPGFEANDVGFLRQADTWNNVGWLGYQQFQPGDLLRRYSIYFNSWHHQTFGGERTAAGLNVNGSFTLLNYWGGWGGVERQFESTNVRVLRGGPSMPNPSAWNWWAGFNSDDRKPVILEAGMWRWKDTEDSDAGGYWAEITFRPQANLQLTLGPEWSWTNDDWLFVNAQEALGRERYILGDVEQNSIWLTTRLNWTFTPDLSLQLYAQPFVSAGNYLALREVVDPDAESYAGRFAELGPDRQRLEAGEKPGDPGVYRVDLDRDGVDDISLEDPNFNSRALRSTFVLRWEYLSGSTIFLVWSHNRSDSARTGRFRALNDLGELFGAPSTNIFSVKVNYYLNP